MLHIVMDTAGDLPEEWLDEYQIHIIPINIHFGEKTYLQGVDISNAEFYRLARESGTIPKTSQPTPAQFIKLYDQIASFGDTILSVHVTGKLSGTLHSAEIAARELADKFNVVPFDSFSGTVAMGYMCREARLLDRAGRTIDDIINQLDGIRKSIRIVLTLDSMEFARMSGRVKTLQAALASILNIKPIIDLKEGILNVSDRVRTRRKSILHLIDYMVEVFGKMPVNVGVLHAEDPESGNTLMELVKQSLNCQETIFSELSIGIAANLGPGTIGIVAYPCTRGN